MRSDEVLGGVASRLTRGTSIGDPALLLMRRVAYGAIVLGALFTSWTSVGYSLLMAATPGTESILLLMTIAAFGNRSAPTKASYYLKVFCFFGLITIVLKWMLRSIGSMSFPFLAWTMAVLALLEALFQLLMLTGSEVERSASGPAVQEPAGPEGQPQQQDGRAVPQAG